MLLKSARLEPLRSRGFALLYASTFIWYFGRWMDALLSSWLALQLTNSPWHVALIGFYRNLPVMVFGSFAGALADRIERRHLVIMSGLLNMVTAATVAALYFSHNLQFWHLALANFLLGLAWTVDYPTRRAMMPDVVPPSQLLPAMVLDTIAMNASRVGGPVLGGVILALFDVTESFIALAAVYSIAIVPLLFLRIQQQVRRSNVSALRFVADGLRFCQKSAPVRGVVIITFLMNALAFPFVQMLAVFAKDVLHVGPFELGLLTSGDGIGSLIGAGLLSAFGFRAYGKVFALTTILMCTSLVVFSASHWFIASLLLLILAGVGHAGFTTLQSTITLNVAGEEMRGRVMGVVTLAIGSATLGMLLTGALASAFGVQWAVGGCSALAAVLIAFTTFATPGLWTYEPRPEQVGSATTP